MRHNSRQAADLAAADGRAHGLIGRQPTARVINRQRRVVAGERVDDAVGVLHRGRERLLAENAAHPCDQRIANRVGVQVIRGSHAHHVE